MKRAVLVLALLGALAAPPSGASFNHTTTNSASVTTDTAANYLRLFSQGSDPDGLGAYATKRGSAPPAPAATGADGGLAVTLGGYKNDPGTTVARVLTLAARSALPGGLASITVRAALVADASGRQPLTGVTFSPLAGTPTSSTVTLTPGQKVQLNLSVRMKNSEFPGNNTLYHPAVLLTVRYAGYGGDFLTYTVPVSAWDGNGAGP